MGGEEDWLYRVYSIRHYEIGRKVVTYIAKFNGRRLKSINAFYNKRKAKMQSKLSERGKKWSQKLQSLTNWRNAVVNDYMHKATSYVVKTCVEHGISKVLVGDVVKSLNKLGQKNLRPANG